MILGTLTIIMFAALLTVGFWVNKIMKSHNRMKYVSVALYMGISAIIILMISLSLMMGLGACDMSSFFARFSLLCTLFLMPSFYVLFVAVSIGKIRVSSLSLHFLVPLLYIILTLCLGFYASTVDGVQSNRIVKFCLSYGFNTFMSAQIVYYIISMSVVFSRYKFYMSNYFADKKYTDFPFVVNVSRLFSFVILIVVTLLAIRLNTLVRHIEISLIYCFLFYMVDVILGYTLSRTKAKGLPDDPELDVKELTLGEIQDLEDKYDELDALHATQKISVNISEVIEEWVNSKSMPYLRSKLTINEVSEEMHIPLKILSSYLNTTLGQNFNTWINTYRINHVKYLLLSTDMTLDEMASTCGFTDRSALSRIFRTMVGVTPSDYKIQNAGIKL